MSEDVRPVLLNFLTQRYGDLKLRLSRRLGSDDLAGDALQDTWLRLQRLEQQGPILDPRSFLLRMAVNIAVDQQRSQSRVLPRGEIEALLDLPDLTPGPEQRLEDRQEMAALMNVLQRLPARRREILILVRWEGLPQKEVAARLGVSLRTVELEFKIAHDYCAARFARHKK